MGDATERKHAAMCRAMLEQFVSMVQESGVPDERIDAALLSLVSERMVARLGRTIAAANMDETADDMRAATFDVPPSGRVN